MKPFFGNSGPSIRKEARRSGPAASQPSRTNRRIQAPRGFRGGWAGRLFCRLEFSGAGAPRRLQVALWAGRLFHEALAGVPEDRYLFLSHFL